MTWNVWRGGDQVHFDAVVEAIRVSGVNVVAVQEIEGNLGRLANELGVAFFWNARLQLVSRLPLFDPQPLVRADLVVVREGDFILPYAWVQVAPHQVVAVCNIHRPSCQDGPEALRDATDDTAIRVQEHAIRGTCVERICSAMVALHTLHRMPVFVVGDFNSRIAPRLPRPDVPSCLARDTHHGAPRLCRCVSIPLQRPSHAPWTHMDNRLPTPAHQERRTN